MATNPRQYPENGEKQYGEQFKTRYEPSGSDSYWGTSKESLNGISDRDSLLKRERSRHMQLNRDQTYLEEVAADKIFGHSKTAKRIEGSISIKNECRADL